MKLIIICICALLFFLVSTAAVISCCINADLEEDDYDTEVPGVDDDEVR